MKKQKYLINLNHVHSYNSFKNFSDICNGFFVSSCNLKKEYMKKLLKSKNCDFDVYIDFFHYVSTVEISKKNTNRFNNEINSRLIEEISIKKNLVSLFLLKKDEEAISEIKRSIQNWIKLISTTEKTSKFVFAIPFPMIGSGSIYKKVIDTYCNELIENLEKFNNINKFIHIVLKVGNRVENNILESINYLIKTLNIDDIFISIWRNDDVLLTNEEEISKIKKTINYLYSESKNIFLNYLHNEFILLSYIFKDININYVFGTYEQTKILSPKIRWMNEDNNFQRFDNKIYLEQYGINVKLKRLHELLEFDLDEYINENVLTFKNNDSFRFNIENMKKTLSKNIISTQKNIIQNIKNILIDPYSKKLFNKASVYLLETYLSMYELNLEDRN